MIETAFKRKRVLVTGHTGFKGSWLCEWLAVLGADVHGYAQDPEPWQTLFGELGLADRLASDERGDLAERERLERLISELEPDFVFHLAAQPLVRRSYERPVETFATNVMGSVHVLEALRRAGSRCIAVMVTTDKCYENREWLHGYREEDPLGGHDPYSASKGAAEIAIASYRAAYFSAVDSPVLVASARAGNVIGGGDWAPDRIVPDCFRALQRGEAVAVRNPTATRPWQHVLEPLCGYLTLAARLAEVRDAPRRELPPLSALTGAFNFGPALASNRTVAQLVEEILKHTGGEWVNAAEAGAHHEAGKLNLATDKAWHLLGWQSVWDFATTVEELCAGYRAGEDGAEVTRRQIAAYTAAAKRS